MTVKGKRETVECACIRLKMPSAFYGAESKCTGVNRKLWVASNKKKENLIFWRTLRKVRR